MNCVDGSEAHNRTIVRFFNYKKYEFLCVLRIHYLYIS